MTSYRHCTPLALPQNDRSTEEKTSMCDFVTLLHWLLYAKSDEKAFTYSLHVLQRTCEWIHCCKEYNASSMPFLKNNSIQVRQKALHYLRQTSVLSNNSVNNVFVPFYRYDLQVISVCCDTLLLIEEPLSPQLDLTGDCRDVLLDYCKDVKSLLTSDQLKKELNCIDTCTFYKLFEEISSSYNNIMPSYTKATEMEGLFKDFLSRKLAIKIFWQLLYTLSNELAETLVLLWRHVRDILPSQQRKFQRINPSIEDQHKTSIFSLFMCIKAVTRLFNHLVFQVGEFRRFIPKINAEEKTIIVEVGKTLFQLTVLKVLNSIINCSLSKTSLFHFRNFCNSRLCSETLTQMYTMLLYCIKIDAFFACIYNKGPLFFIRLLNVSLLPLCKTQVFPLDYLHIHKETTESLINGLLVFTELFDALLCEKQNFPNDTKSSLQDQWKHELLSILWIPSLSTSKNCFHLDWTYPQSLAMSHIIMLLNFIFMLSQSLSELNVIKWIQKHESDRCFRQGIPTAIYAVYLYITKFVPNITLACNIKKELEALKVRLLDESIYIGDHQHPYIDFRLTLVNFLDNYLKNQCCV